MSEYFVLRIPATIMGYKIVLVEWEHQIPNRGCCANEGIVVFLLVSDASKKLEQLEYFAEHNFCNMEVMNHTAVRQSMFWKPSKSTFKPGRYAVIDCKFDYKRSYIFEE